MKSISTQFIVIVSVVAGMLLPATASAATITLKTSALEVHVGDTIVVEARLNTEGQSINVVEGTVSFGAASLVDVRELGTAGSAFTLWPRGPALVSGSADVTFTGGVPKGVNSPDALLFAVALHVKKSGVLTLAAPHVRAYANDGKGTAVDVRVAPRSLTIVKALSGTAPRDEWATLSSGDVTPPEPFVVTKGNSPAIFDGKDFIAFSTTDSQSGVDYYEITEGDIPPVRSDNTYVLQHSGTAETITVRAHDKAGNVRVATLDMGATKSSVLPLSLAVLACLLVGGFVLWRRKRSTV